MRLREETKSKISVLLWLCQVVIVWVLISVLIWLCLKPISPVYMITNAYVPALNQHNSTEPIRNNSVVNLNFELSNPNERIGIYYNDIIITLYYKDTVIGTNSLAGFYQGYKKATSYGVLVNATDDHQLLRRGVLTGNTTTVEMIRVCLKTAVRYKIFLSTTKHHRMNFEACICIGSDGRISGQREIKLQQMMVKEKIKDGN